MKCNDKLGLCTFTNEKQQEENKQELENTTLFYIGDPMCSWCYAMSDILKKVQEYCSLNNISFEPILGGLRTSKVENWDDDFKNFLQNEWLHISKVAAKKFSFELFKLNYFEYITTNACKAVFIIKKLSKNKNNNRTTMEFFSKIQKKFYAQSLDPKELAFYRDICEDLGFSFSEFSKLFIDKEIQEELKKELNYSRTFSSSMPSLVLIKGDKKTDISIGYSSLDEVISRIDRIF